MRKLFRNRSSAYEEIPESPAEGNNEESADAVQSEEDRVEDTQSEVQA